MHIAGRTACVILVFAACASPAEEIAGRAEAIRRSQTMGGLTGRTIRLTPFGGSAFDTAVPDRESVVYAPSGVDTFTRAEYLGDDSMYLALFDVDHNTFSENPSGNALMFNTRYNVPYSNNFVGYAVGEGDLPLSWRESMMNQPWAGAQTVRWYDAGECRQRIPWRDFFMQISAAIDPAIVAEVNDGPCVDDAKEYGNRVFTPLLRTDPADDGFRYHITLDFDICSAFDGDFELTFSGDIKPDGSGGLLFTLAAIDHLYVTLASRDEVFDKLMSPVTGIQPRFNAALPAALATPMDPEIACTPGPGGDDTCKELIQFAFTLASPGTVVASRNAMCLPVGESGGHCAFVPDIQRVNYTPAWIEFVLTENPGDNFDFAYRDADLCESSGFTPDEDKEEDSSIVGVTAISGGSFGPLYHPLHCGVYPADLIGETECCGGTCCPSTYCEGMDH